MPESNHEISPRSPSPLERLRNLVDALCEEPFETETPEEEGTDMLTYHEWLSASASMYIAKANLAGSPRASDAEEEEEPPPAVEV